MTPRPALLRRPSPRAIPDPAPGARGVSDRLRRAAASLLAALALLAGGKPAGAQEATPPWLVVRDAAGLELLALPLAADPDWVVRWNHSVSGVLVSDFYALRDGTMILTDSHTPAFDAGLGHIPGRGRQLSDGAGGYWIVDIDEPVPGNAYALRVGSPAVDHRIVHAGRTHSLSALAAGERVRIGVEPR